MRIAIQEYSGIETYSQLPPDVVTGIGRCVNSAFGGTVTEEDALNHMAGDQVLVATDEEVMEIVGFTSTSMTSPQEMFGDPALSDHVGTYFAGAAIARKAQGNGLYHVMNRRRYDFALNSGSEIIFTRTQNPRVVEGITDDMDRLVAEGRIAAYGVTQVIQQGAYGTMLTATKPKAKHLELDLDYDRGDAAIVSWKMEK